MNKSAGEKQGTLYMVATPIGNLEDITLRALRILKEVDLIAAEDTRHSRILLSAYNIKTPLISLHEHNEKERSALVVSRIEQGMSVAYISDAGTPCISDPGHHLVNLALTSKISVVPVPGSSALITALSVCGFPADQFSFYGFLPPKENKRRRFLEAIGDEEKTVIFYESPARIMETLKDVYDILGDRSIVVARELTKVFEEIKRGRISDILLQAPLGKAKGEFTVILQGVSRMPVSLTDDQIRESLLLLWEESPMSLRDAVAEVVRQTGLSRKKIYDIAVKIRPSTHRD
ncbi:MAG: 16S rRNA (cytidine(1402)-2'-O)-methyltransferase [Deltaproteobacteria bacterium HGW-Deltaproteobacteria-6]|jgi:16S rRNA (cytidine1402-2'-O)-methyltransferase|nr:MAG: 16S rRNA (cytidine(1402)-2'-O)-methyltransferase [Deltaproteobacteria bacterium HGW-Deltaproteobacteria-6]